MPLEYLFYVKKKSLEDWTIRSLVTWGTEYIKEFSMKDRLAIYFKAIPYIPERIKNYNVKFPVPTYEEYMLNLNPTAILTKNLNGKYIVNPFGDFSIDNPSKIKSNFRLAYFHTTDFKNYIFEQLKEFSNCLAKQNIQVILTYPVSIQNPDFDLSQKEHLVKIKTLQDKIKKYGLIIIGIPELSQFELPYSFDFPYHLNAEGAILHTLYFADMINSYLADKAQEIPDLEAYKNEKKKEAKEILEEYRKLGYVDE